MKVAVALLCVAFACGARAGDDAAPERSFVEVLTPRTDVFVQQPIELRLRFGVDAEFLRDNAVQLFQQRLDVPVQVDAPWLAGLAGTVARTEAAPPTATRGALTFVLNGTVARAVPVPESTRGGRRFTVFEIARTFLPQSAGTLVVSAPRLRYSYAKSFGDDFVRERLPSDRREESVESPPLAIHVVALPADGRPAEFTGAVGAFEVEFGTDRSDLSAGDTASLTLRIRGDGNLEAFDAPRLDGVPGLHVLGTLDDRALPVRTIRYDVKPLVAMTEFPPFAWAWFDPAPPGRYVVWRPGPIPFRVRAPVPGDAAPPARSEERASGGWVLALLAAAVVAVAAALVLRRRRGPDPQHVDPRDQRIRHAAAEFESRVSADADLAESLAAFLAACLERPVASVISPDLAARLAQAGVPAPLAERTASFLETLVAARYGGVGPEGGQSLAATRALVEEVEAALLSERAGNRTGAAA